MKDIFKEPDMPEYLSSSSSEPDDDNDDGSQLANENEERKAVIIVNNESDATYEGKYKDNVEFVLYEGSTAAQWKTCLPPEDDKNHRMQMDNLRSRISSKILLHEVNIYQKKMSDYAKKITEAGEGGSNRQ
ncbi:hypothetical protein Tco_1067370 [Tanacetum coccineum]|uniref:Uncharacterized protein n=1 Tax=Tanacetum coccineum TaxID=301880 RepID=A0ABQ5HCN6_9ASTR